MSVSLPNLRVSFSDFFDPDLTFLTLLHHLFLYIGVNALLWNLYWDPGHPVPATKVVDRTLGISQKMLIFNALAYSARLVEYCLPRLHDFTYEFAACAGFAALLWLGAMLHMIYHKRRTPIVGQSRMQLNITLFVTGGMAYTYNYGHLKFTPSLFCWAWSHYLEAIAMLPQLWTMIRLHKNATPLSTSLWVGIHVTALGRLFQLLNWTYLLYDSNILDQLQFMGSFFSLLAYVIFLGVILFQRMTIKELPKEVRNKPIMKKAD